MAPGKKFVPGIHQVDYTEQYESRQTGADTAIFCGGRACESLNGKWHYAVDQYDTCIRQKWYLEQYVDNKGFTLPIDYSFDEWPEIELPCSWNTVEEKYLLYEGSMIFTRTFGYLRDDKPDSSEAHFNDLDNTAINSSSALNASGRNSDLEEVYLRIGAANYIVRVFLNGEYIGMHRGGSTPAFFLLTDKLKENNRLILQVDSTRRPEQVPTENTDWFNYGGIYRDIELIRVPKIHIKDFKISLVPGGSYDRISVEAEISEAIDTTAVISIDELGIQQEFDIKEGHGSCVIACRPELWSPENPRLYDVSLSCRNDRVCDRVGFREISVNGREILLNGQPVFLRGVSCHEDSAENGKALSREERIENIKIAKELGCNFMRLAHYPHHEETAKLADEMGLLLWEEIPVYWAIRFDRGKTYEDAENQLEELIKRDYNRASVIIWSVGNENADTDERLAFMKGLADRAHEIDKTRLVSAACLVDGAGNRIADRLAEYLDIIGLNEYCGWYTPDFASLPELMANSDPDKPVIITEFGADAMAGHHGTVEDKGTEECQKYVYERQIEVLKDIDYIKGMTPWILYDFRCPRRTSVIQKYYNRKGLLSEDKKYRKPAFYVLQEFYKSKS
ncbi:MAG: glycoside hydrolase family 2 [Lachnospiraceae bacterium]|nr:glycoside hydrolase family 2 [Lachnospiraceae bacterium]